MCAFSQVEDDNLFNFLLLLELIKVFGVYLLFLFNQIDSSVPITLQLSIFILYTFLSSMTQECPNSGKKWLILYFVIYIYLYSI